MYFIHRVCRVPSLLFLTILLPIAACGDPVVPDVGVPIPPDVRPWVTGAAAAALGPDGRFLLTDPGAPGPDPIVDREFAADLALAFMRTLVANPDVALVGLELEHGGPIDWSAVQFEPRHAYFGETPYEPLPEFVPLALRRYYGPKYLVPLFVRGQQVASVSAAAYTTDIEIDERGFVDLPAFSSGNPVIYMGVPRGLPFRMPLWPEEAVRFAAEATGARVTEVPQLLLPVSYAMPQGVRWRLELDREVEVRAITTGSLERTRTVYLGVAPGPVPGIVDAVRVVWYLPADEQPQSQILHYVPVGERDPQEIEIGVRSDVPIHFVEVEPLG